MSLIDKVTIFTETAGDTLLPASSGTASTNAIDTGDTLADLSGNYHGAGYVNVIIKTALTGACSVVVQDSADNSTFTTVTGCEVALSGNAAGSRFTVKLPKTTRRYIRTAVTYSTKPTAGSYIAYLGNPETDH